MRQIILELTDLQYHSTIPRPASSVKGILTKGLKPHDPASGRLYILGFEPDGRPIVAIPPEWQTAIDRGDLELIIKMPEGGIPQSLGKDALEKLASFERSKQKQARHIARVHEKSEK